MVDIDDALSVFQNKARRDILERLVREPHYPLQIANQIGISQQAVMKHLNFLEKKGFVVKMRDASNKGGTPKNIRSVQESISIRIDLGPDLFQCSQRSLPSGGPLKLTARLPNEVNGIAEMVSGRKRISVGEGAFHLSKITESIEKLDRERDALVSLHQQIKQRVSTTVDSDFESYEQRLMIHNILEAPGAKFNFKSFASELNLGAEATEKLIEDLRVRMVRHMAERSGQFISASQTTELPWWAALGIDSRD